MRSVQTCGSTQDQRPRTSPACLALTGTVARLLSVCPSVTPSTFLSPFAPRPLRRFSAPMRTVTPRQVSCPTEVSPLHVTRRFETILPPNTQRPPSSLSHATPQLDGSPLTGARLRQWLAGSPATSGRIKFVSLRTGLSPPVALHLASRRRSYLRFPGRRAYAWRGLAPLYVCARERTSPGLSARGSEPRKNPSPNGATAGPGASAPRRGMGSWAHAQGLCRRPVGARNVFVPITRGRRACGALTPGYMPSPPWGSLHEEVSIPAYSK